MLVLLPHDASEVSSSYHAYTVETILRDNASVNHGWSQVCLEVVLNTSFETSCSEILMNVKAIGEKTSQHPPKKPSIEKKSESLQ